MAQLRFDKLTLRPAVASSLRDGMALDFPVCGPGQKPGRRAGSDLGLQCCYLIVALTILVLGIRQRREKARWLLLKRTPY